MKTAVVIVSGAPEGDNLRELEIQAGTNAGDVLRALNLQGYLLSREGSAQVFAAEEDIYAAIQDGDKLRAAPVAEVGGFWQSLLQVLGLVEPRVEVHTAPTVRERPAARTMPSSRHLMVERDRRALWEVRGWRRDGQWLIGAYRTPWGAFSGEISLRRSRPEFYILNPPRALLRGSHGSCFRSRGGGKYFVHFGIGSPDVDAGIVGIEKLIAAAIGRRVA